MNPNTKIQRKSFMLTLKQILNSKEYENIITVSENNNGFTITDQKQFAERVLQDHFKKPNWQSFKRQLNLYGFNYRRTKEGYLQFENDQFNILNSETPKIKQQKNVQLLTMEQELLLMKIQLQELQENQQKMIQNLNIIQKQQETVQNNLKKALIEYIRVRVNGQNRGRKMGLFVYKFHKSIKDKNYKKFLYKNWLCIQQQNQFLPIDSDRLSRTAFNKEFYKSPFSSSSIFDISIPTTFFNKYSTLQICEENQEYYDEDEENQLEPDSCSNLSIYFNI